MPDDAVQHAVEILRRGGLVAFPTETVYGLGADATSAVAVRRIFAAKGRPATNPLIAHVQDADVAQRYAREWPDSARTLADRFWPGPLTLVLPKNPAIVDEATAGLDSVGLRVPNHPLALELLRAFNGPVAAPSANRSTRVSPTTAQHVREELADAVDLVLDGGPCAVGIESTVLDLTSRGPRILRPGGISREAIEALIGPVGDGAGVTRADAAALSPGQMPVHYAPATPAYRYDAGDCRLDLQEDAGLIAMGDVPHPRRSGRLATLPRDPEHYARHFYATLRALDVLHLRAIYVEYPPDEPKWTAVRDRIRRATRPMRLSACDRPRGTNASPLHPPL
jgi:L-threonylcarbamoyladenylate synthase